MKIIRKQGKIKIAMDWQQNASTPVYISIWINKYFFIHLSPRYLPDSFDLGLPNLTWYALCVDTVVFRKTRHIVFGRVLKSFILPFDCQVTKQFELHLVGIHFFHIQELKLNGNLIKINDWGWQWHVVIRPYILHEIFSFCFGLT